MNSPEGVFDEQAEERRSGFQSIIFVDDASSCIVGNV